MWAVNRWSCGALASLPSCPLPMHQQATYRINAKGIRSEEDTSDVRVEGEHGVLGQILVTAVNIDNVRAAQWARALGG